MPEEPPSRVSNTVDSWGNPPYYRRQYCIEPRSHKPQDLRAPGAPYSCPEILRTFLGIQNSIQRAIALLRVSCSIQCCISWIWSISHPPTLRSDLTFGDVQLLVHFIRWQSLLRILHLLQDAAVLDGLSPSDLIEMKQSQGSGVRTACNALGRAQR